MDKEEKKEQIRRDRLWKKRVRERDGERCAICGRQYKLNCHHIIPKEINQWRWDLDNGICLCPRHHRFSRALSAHQNSLAFYMWMEEHRPEQLKRLKDDIRRLADKFSQY